MIKFAGSLSAFCLVVVFGQVALASPSFHADAGALSGQNSESNTGASPQTADANAQSSIFDGGGNVIGSFTGSGSSSAGKGVLKASGRSTVDISNHQCCLSNQVYRDSAGHASFALDDIVITGPGATVDAILNLSFTGTLSGAAQHANILGSAGGHVNVAINGNVAGQGFSGGAQLDVDSAHPGQTTYSNSGILAGYTGGALDVHIAFAALPVGVPLGMFLDLSVSALATYVVQGTGPDVAPIFADLFGDYSHSLSFASGGPVFTLDAGYSADSAQGQIDNNQWVGNVVVPAPGALALFAVGVAALCSLRRRIRI